MSTSSSMGWLTWFPVNTANLIRPQVYPSGFSYPTLFSYLLLFFSHWVLSRGGFWVVEVFARASRCMLENLAVRYDMSWTIASLCDFVYSLYDNDEQTIEHYTSWGTTWYIVCQRYEVANNFRREGRTVALSPPRPKIGATGRLRSNLLNIKIWIEIFIYEIIFIYFVIFIEFYDDPSILPDWVG